MALFLTSIIFLLQLEACAHPFFDELREPNARLPNGRPFPPLFNFKQEVRNYSINLIIWKTQSEKYKPYRLLPVYHAFNDVESVFTCCWIN